uniref:BTB domain-containing protein n=1 Tax=Panagrolaimus superbus TaxID=310955 RepID=A0A914XYB6_9BILA
MNEPHFNMIMQLERHQIFDEQNTENGYFDVEFEIENRKLYAHRIILAPASNVFRAMFSKVWSDQPLTNKITAYKFKTFKNFFDIYLYGKL